MHPSRALPGYTNILVTRGPPEGWPGAQASLSQYDSSGTLDSQSTRVPSDEEEDVPVLDLEARSEACRTSSLRPSSYP